MQKIRCRKNGNFLSKSYEIRNLLSILSILPIPVEAVKGQYLKKTILTLLIGSILLSSCRKESFSPFIVNHVDPVDPVVSVVPCQWQTENPSGRSYSASAVETYNCIDKLCGMLPLSIRNYWVYEDSIFNNGVLLRVQFDTLRFTNTRRTATDGLVWWEASLYVGLPSNIYSNESGFFTLESRLFAPDVVDARKEFEIPAGDSAKYLTSFEDIAAIGRSIRLSEPVASPAGTFTDCIYFEKNARFFRRDQLFVKPGVGIIKYIQEKAPAGDRNIKLQQVSTLVAMHIE